MGADSVCIRKLMSPAIITLVFAPLAILAVWSIMRDFAIGIAQDEIYRFRADTNPTGFLVVIGGKIFVIVFGIAMILHAYGFIGDPVKALRPIFEPFG